MLNPTISSGWPRNRDETRAITPGVSMLHKQIVKIKSLKKIIYQLLQQLKMNRLKDLNVKLS